MTNPVESELNGKHDVLTLAGEQGRIEQLVTENERLRCELEKLHEVYERDIALLNAYTLERLPKTEEEFLRLATEGPTFKELLNELIPEVVQEVKS